MIFLGNLLGKTSTGRAHHIEASEAMVPGFTNYQALPAPELHASLVLAHIREVFRGIHPAIPKSGSHVGLPTPCHFIKGNLASEVGSLQHAIRLP